MKKTTKNIAVLSLCTFATINFTSCSDDDNTPNLPTEPVETPTTMVVEGFYKGDIYDNETANLWLNFISKELKYDEDEEDYTGTGEILCLDFNTTPATNPDFPTLADGTYTADDSHDEFTLNVDFGDSYLVKYTNSVSSYHEIVGGTATVSHSGANTVIAAQLELDNGEIYDFEYTGPVSILNRSGEGQMSNLMENVTVKDLTQGIAMYQGEAFTETSDHYIVVLAGKDFNLETNYGESASVMLGLNVNPGSSTGIPSGTYTVINALEADDYDPFTCLSGVYEPSYGGFMGAWFFSTLDALEASAQSGTVEVTNNGNDNYTFKLNLKDGYGHTITGEYTGHLDVEDYS